MFYAPRTVRKYYYISDRWSKCATRPQVGSKMATEVTTEPLKRSASKGYSIVLSKKKKKKSNAFGLKTKIKCNMALLAPYSKIPEPNTATILLVENEEKFQSKLADAIVQREKDGNVNVRLACKLPLPFENSETRPRVDLVVFIVNLLSERSLQVVENSLNHLRSDFFLGKVCFMVTDARCGALTQERLLSVKKLAASHRCPLICAEHQTEDGVAMAASRLLTILKVSAGLSPMATTALYLSTLTRCTVPSELDED